MPHQNKKHLISHRRQPRTLLTSIENLSDTVKGAFQNSFSEIEVRKNDISGLEETTPFPRRQTLNTDAIRSITFKRSKPSWRSFMVTSLTFSSNSVNVEVWFRKLEIDRQSTSRSKHGRTSGGVGHSTIGSNSNWHQPSTLVRSLICFRI